MTIVLSMLAQYLDTYFAVERIPNDQNGIYRPSQRIITRIGLALEPWAAIGTWAHQEQVDALLLHRPWKLDMQVLPADVGILAYHLAFDLHLTTGFNPRLASTLHMKHPAPFAFKDGIPLGMWSAIQATPLPTIAAQLTEIFGTPPVIEQAATDEISTIAVVGTMTDSLIREAAGYGVQLYITGQYRQPARKAVRETQISVAALGHATSEQWGLRALAGLLRERWAQLEVVLAPNELPSPHDS